MRSFINAIFSILLSSIEPYLSQNMYTPQTQPRAQVLDRTVEEQLEGNKKTRYSSAGSANVSHRHHKTTACSGSMEYWVRNGPEGNDPDFDEFTIPPTSDSPISLSEISKDSVTYPEAPRLGPIARCVTPPSVPNLTLDISTMINTSSTSSPPSTPGLPSISFSPLLRATRLALDADASRKASLFGLATATPTAGKETSPLFGLGIFDVSRKEDCSHAFDGLGIVRIQSSPWRPKSKTSPVKYGDEFLEEHGDGDQDCNHISETFLHDLEAFFLVRDFTPSSSGPLSFSNHCSGDEHMTFDNIIEEPTTESGEGNSSPMVTATYTEPLPVPVAGNRSCPPSANKNSARRIRNALSLTPRRAARPPSVRCGSSAQSRIQAASCSIATPTDMSMPALSMTNGSYALTPSSSSSSASFGIPTSSSGSRSAFARRTCSAFTLSCRDTRSSSRTVSVSMGSSPSPSRNIKSKGIAPLGLGDRSLQSHSVRDLSVVGTISSDLKRKMIVSTGPITSFEPGSA